jgi:curved DNA-binding protein CbpA
MLQSQGSRPLDPYRTLQLHPLATRELIGDAYWMLVERARAMIAHGARASACLGDLNEAYAVLADDARRARYDGEHAVSAAAPIAPDARAPGYYELLCVDPEADPHLIEIAYRSRLRDAAAGAADRALLDEAYRTLANRELRAQYDAHLSLPAQDAGGAPERPWEQAIASGYPDLARAEPPVAQANKREAVAPLDHAQFIAITTERRLMARVVRRGAPGREPSAEEMRLLGLRKAGDCAAPEPNGQRDGRGLAERV